MKIALQKTPYHRFTFAYSYSQEKVDFCRVLKESFGFDKFSFNGDLKSWVFSDSYFVPVIQEKFPEVEIEPQVKEIVVKEQQWATLQKTKKEEIDEIRIKKDTNFHVKGLKKELYPFQKVGVEFLVASGGRCIIADEMGVGKTAQSLAYIKHMGYKRTLVVCPASVKFSWGLEAKKWTSLSSIIIDSKTDLAKIDPLTNLWIINYDVLKKHHDQLSKVRFDSMIGDECQMIKSTTALRTKAFRSISRNINSVVLLSGTPLLSRPSELFSLLNILDQKNWSNWYDYARKFCDGHQGRFGFDSSGVSNTGELHARIKRYFIRRTKAEVLAELPEKIFIEVPVELDKETAKKYEVAARNLATYLREHAGKQPAEIARSMAAEKLTQLNVLRQLNALGKVDTAIELIEAAVEAGEKVLVFSSFVEPLERVQAHFGAKAVIITGKTDVKDRQGIVESFQNNKNVQVFCGGYKSAGVGITLTAASNFVAIDLPWNPADLEQSIGRLHRIGQVANSVNIYQLFAVDTIDADMRDTLDRKQNIFDTVIDGKVAEQVTKTMMDAAIKSVLKKY